MTDFSKATSSCLASPGVGQTGHLLITAILSLSAPRHFAKTEIFLLAFDNSENDSKNPRKTSYNVFPNVVFWLKNYQLHFCSCFQYLTNNFYFVWIMFNIKKKKILPLLHLFLCEGIFCATPPIFVKNEQFFTCCFRATRVFSAVPAQSC